MDAEFTNYAYQDFPLKKIKKYAAQYNGVDMAALLGADENNFPFLVRRGDDEYELLIWNAYNGAMIHENEDSVFVYAVVQYLLDNAYPVFDSHDAAEKLAVDHDWPRETRDA
ncbi:MAG: hypothetical protein NXI04_30115 [Planctomycetaceae bacterium]|nr:hypothetical protein [Planctomycetaceae bacterium]